MVLKDYLVVSAKYIKILPGMEKSDREKLRKDIQAEGGKWSQKKKQYYFKDGVPAKYKSVKSPAKSPAKKKPVSKKGPAKKKLFEKPVEEEEEEEEVEEEEVEESETESPNKGGGSVNEDIEDNDVVMFEKEYAKPVANKKKKRSLGNRVRRDRRVEEIEGLPVTASTGHIEKKDMKKFYHGKGYNIQQRALSLLFQENSALACLFTLTIHKYSKASRYDPERDPGKVITVASALPAIQIARYVNLDLDETIQRKEKKKVSKKGTPQLDTVARGPKKRKARSIWDDDETETLLGFSGNLYDQSIGWLKKYAKSLGVKQFSGMNKDLLIDAILKVKLDEVRKVHRAKGYAKRTENVDIGSLFGDAEPMDPEEEVHIKEEPPRFGPEDEYDEPDRDDEEEPFL